MLDVTSSELLWLAVAVVAAGLFTGVLAGLFGVGGGAVIVPALYEVFRILDVPADVRMQLCIGTSLAIIVPTTVRSYLAHRAVGAVIPQVVRLWSPPAILGVILGSLVAAWAPAGLFKIAFVIFATFVSAKMLFGRNWSLGVSLPARAVQRGFGFLTGLVSALVGVSGGSISNAALTLYGKPIQQAVATSAGIGVPITIVGTAGYILAGWRYMPVLPPLSLGFVSLIGLVLVAPLSSMAAPYGARMAHRLSRRQLEIAFGVFLTVASLRFIASCCNAGLLLFSLNHGVRWPPYWNTIEPTIVNARFWHGPADFRTAAIPSVIWSPADTPLAVATQAPCWSALVAESTEGRNSD